MKQADEITIKAFLIALEQLETPLPEAKQTQLLKIAEDIENHLEKLEAIAQSQLKLSELYQEIRSFLQNQYAQHNGGAIASNYEHSAFTHNLAYESQKILNMSGIQLALIFKDFIKKIQLETNYQLKNPLEKDSECLVGLSKDELEALAESILSISKQEQLNALLTKNTEAQLSSQEAESLDCLLTQIDRLTILKTRARYTLKKLDELMTA
jgi:hypothetical protein